MFFLVRFLPKTTIESNKNETNFFRHQYLKRISIIRENLNKCSLEKREKLVIKYIIPMLNLLFDKNYVNYAQFGLFAMEEWILSKNTEKTFEDALSLFSHHAIAAGLRFREKYPITNRKISKSPKIGFFSNWVGKIGYECVLGLGKFFTDYSSFIVGASVIDVSPNEKTIEDTWKEAGFELIVSDKYFIYNVFEMRNLFIRNEIDIAMWVLPPMQMFFYFSFGLAPKQVFFSNYIHPNLSFKYLDDYLTLGGVGEKTIKIFNGKEWNIIPQQTRIEMTSQFKDIRVLFAPARLEKIKQPNYLNTVIEIMKKCPNTVFKWTGANKDKEVIKLFISNNLLDRQEYVPWMNNNQLIQEIKSSDIILETFPFGFGTTNIMASIFNKPIVSLYDDKNPLYWRDIYWEANNGNLDLQKICFDIDGNSKIKINKNLEDYIEDAVKIINDSDYASKNADVFRKAFEYAYLNNPNNIKKIFNNFIDSLRSKL